MASAHPIEKLVDECLRNLTKFQGSAMSGDQSQADQALHILRESLDQAEDCPTESRNLSDGVYSLAGLEPSKSKTSAASDSAYGSGICKAADEKSELNVRRNAQHFGAASQRWTAGFVADEKERSIQTPSESSCAPSTRPHRALAIPCIVDGCPGMDMHISQLLRKASHHHGFSVCIRCYCSFDSVENHQRHSLTAGNCEPHCISSTCESSKACQGQLFNLKHPRNLYCPAANVVDRWRFLYHMMYPDRQTPELILRDSESHPHGPGRKRLQRRSASSRTGTSSTQLAQLQERVETEEGEQTTQVQIYQERILRLNEIIRLLAQLWCPAKVPSHLEQMITLEAPGVLSSSEDQFPSNVILRADHALTSSMDCSDSNSGQTQQRGTMSSRDKQSTPANEFAQNKGGTSVISSISERPRYHEHDQTKLSRHRNKLRGEHAHKHADDLMRHVIFTKTLQKMLEILYRRRELNCNTDDCMSDDVTLSIDMDDDGSMLGDSDSDLNSTSNEVNSDSEKSNFCLDQRITSSIVDCADKASLNDTTDGSDGSRKPSSSSAELTPTSTETSRGQKRKNPGSSTNHNTRQGNGEDNGDDEHEDGWRPGPDKFGRDVRRGKKPNGGLIPCFVRGCNGLSVHISEFKTGLQKCCKLFVCSDCCSQLRSREELREHRKLRKNCVPHCISSECHPRANGGQRTTLSTRRHFTTGCCPDKYNISTEDIWQYLYYLHKPASITIPTLNWQYGDSHHHGDGPSRPQRKKPKHSDVPRSTCGDSIGTPDEISGDLKEFKSLIRHLQCQDDINRRDQLDQNRYISQYESLVEAALPLLPAEHRGYFEKWASSIQPPSARTDSMSAAHRMTNHIDVYRSDFRPRATDNLKIGSNATLFLPQSFRPECTTAQVSDGNYWMPNLNSLTGTGASSSTMSAPSHLNYGTQPQGITSAQAEDRGRIPAIGRQNFRLTRPEPSTMRTYHTRTNDVPASEVYTAERSFYIDAQGVGSDNEMVDFAPESELCIARTRLEDLLDEGFMHNDNNMF